MISIDKIYLFKFFPREFFIHPTQNVLKLSPNLLKLWIRQFWARCMTIESISIYSDSLDIVCKLSVVCIWFISPIIMWSPNFSTIPWNVIEPFSRIRYMYKEVQWPNTQAVRTYIVCWRTPKLILHLSVSCSLPGIFNYVNHSIFPYWLAIK